MPDLKFVPEGHKYYWKGREVPSVSSILQPLQPSYFDDGGVAIARGNAVHLATAFDDEDNLDEDTLDDSLVGYVDAWRSLKEDLGLDIVSIELPVYHRVLAYAGTIDRVTAYAGTYSLMDIKTGLPSVTHSLQLAGYAQAYQSQTGIRVTTRHVAYLREDGSYEVWDVTPTADRDDGAFVALRRLHGPAPDPSWVIRKGGPSAR